MHSDVIPVVVLFVYDQKLNLKKKEKQQQIQRRIFNVISVSLVNGEEKKKKKSVLNHLLALHLNSVFVSMVRLRGIYRKV